MKKLAYSILPSLMFFTASAYADKVQLQNDEQKSSYALGVNYMQGLYDDHMELDNQAFLQGIMDIQTGQGSRLNEVESKKALDYFIFKRISHRQEIDENRRLAGENFMLENRLRPGVIELPSGLQYKVLQTGTQDIHPTAKASVNIHLRMTDLDGKDILASPADGSPQKIQLSGLLPGWREAMQLMQAGDKWQIVMPPKLAYGQNGSPDGKVKPNQILLYELELVSIEPAESARVDSDRLENTENTGSSE